MLKFLYNTKNKLSKYKEIKKWVKKIKMKGFFFPPWKFGPKSMATRYTLQNMVLPLWDPQTEFTLALKQGLINRGDIPPRYMLHADCITPIQLW